VYVIYDNLWNSTGGKELKKKRNRVVVSPGLPYCETQLPSLGTEHGNSTVAIQQKISNVYILET
jgi:hypothetical protein